MARASEKLVKRRIEGLMPEPVRYDVFDSEVKGFHIRVLPSGSKTYRLKYVADGRQRVMTIGEHGRPWTPEMARREAECLRGAAKSGRDPMAERATKARAAAEAKRRALTVAELIEKWLSEGPAANPNKRAVSWAHDASRLRCHIIPLLGHVQVTALRRVDLEEAQARIVTGETARVTRTKPRGVARVRGGRTVARGAIVSLSSCLSWAVQRDILAENPARLVRKEKPRTRERFLTLEEVVRLFDVIDAMVGEGSLRGEFADIIRLLLFTGARRTEIVRLAWREVVELESDIRARIVLPRERSKTGEKTIALGGEAVALLRSRPRFGPFVFPSPRVTAAPIDGINRAWRAVRVRAELADVRIHDLRHTFASFAVAEGASLAIVAKALGHAQTSTTERYAHLTADPIRKLADQVSETVARGRRRAAGHGQS